MARTVADAAILFGALEGARPDANDPATMRCTPPPDRDYTRFLDAGALEGARIGVPRAYFVEPVTPPGAPAPAGGIGAAQRRALEEAIAVLRRRGATVVDPADVPSVVDPDPSRNFALFPICSGVEQRKGEDGACSVVLKYGMKRDFNAWLASLGPAAPVRSLTELRAWNDSHRTAGTLKYEQANLDISDEMDVAADRARYQADRQRDLALSTEHGIDAVIGAHQLDALLFPGVAGAALSARAGYPTVAVPFALVPNAPTPRFPDSFEARPSPYGMSFAGTACSEPRLLALAFAFEQATRRRVPPSQFP
jgi:amidase